MRSIPLHFCDYYLSGKTWTSEINELKILIQVIKGVKFNPEELLQKPSQEKINSHSKKFKGFARCTACRRKVLHE